MQALYTLIIDTSEYSGNFVRQICGYITAQIGDCNVGEDEAAEAKNELSSNALAWFEANIEQRAEEDADFRCMRPCAFFPTPGRINNGHGKNHDADGYTGTHRYPAYESVGIFLSAKPSAEIVRITRTRAEAFAQKYESHGGSGKLRILNVRLIESVQVVTEIDTSTLL